MADRAPAVAAFLLSDEGRQYRSPDSLLAACVIHWPGLTRDEFRRAIAIAIARETQRQDGAEHLAEADALDDLAAARRAAQP